MRHLKSIITLLVLYTTPLLGMAQDTIFLRNKTFIACKVYEITPDFIRYKKSENPRGPIYSLPVQKFKRVKYENGFSESRREITTNKQEERENFDSISNRFKAGCQVSIIPANAGIFLQSAITKKYAITLTANYVFAGITHVDNENQLMPMFYIGPNFNLKISKWLIHNSTDVIALNLTYDFIYKRVKKYSWSDGIGSQRYPSKYDRRSEFQYCHRLIFSIQQSLKKTKSFEFGYFVDLGAQWGRRRIKHYTGDYFKTESYTSERLEKITPICFRTGFYLNWSLFKF